MGIARTRPWNASDHLRTEDDMVAYLDTVLAESNPELTVAALKDIARAQGKAEVVEDAGLMPDELSICKDLELGSVLKVLDALGLRLLAAPASRP
ncbi:DNA-binding protein [Candidatus Poriferisocius sp.]|uniref:helix-turn-helix domain-containing transcriptional regulator n=1 Tax=Candidatus Poriferisocius sp. TaxID=3101276 RepID=UPI003B01E1D4